MIISNLNYLEDTSKSSEIKGEYRPSQGGFYQSISTTISQLAIAINKGDNGSAIASNYISVNNQILGVVK